MNSTIYLDNNATTRIDPSVGKAIAAAYELGYVNPASQHRLGRQAYAALEDARESIAGMLGYHADDQFLFCSGGSEANNTALNGLGPVDGGRFITSALEHPSVTEPHRALRLAGHQVDWLRVDASGVIELDHLEQLLQQPADLVSVMYANHETGVVQPIEQVAELCAQRGVYLHCDLAQAIGKHEAVPLPGKLNATTTTVVPHKFHGPLGIAGLGIRRGEGIRPLIRGGSQQLELRPGTENVSLAIGFEVSLRRMFEESAVAIPRMRELRDQLEQGLLAECAEASIVGANSERLANTSCVAFPGVDRQAMLMALDLAGIACSTGSACASGSSEPSPVLVAMGLAESQIEGALRFSLGRDTTATEIASSVDRISSVFNNLRRDKPVKK